MRALPIDIAWHPGLSIYASKESLKSAGTEYGWLGGMDQLGRLRCILPYTVVRKATVRMVRFRVETIRIDDTLGLEEEKSFLNSAVEYFRSIDADVIIPATTNAIFRTYPDNAVAAPYGTYVIDLRQSEETLWKNVHSKHRNVIRNAQNKGVRILTGIEHANGAYSLIRETFKRSSLPFMSHQAFERMLCGLGANVKVFVADCDGVVHGCAVIPFSKQSAYYSYGGTVSQPLSGATNLLQWEAIRYFRSLGVKCYDFCGVRIAPEKGSKAAGLMMYKQRFGSELRQGYIWKRAITPLRSAIYSLSIRLLRGGDIVDRERHKLPEYERALVATNS
jgi:hypothetical protein